MPSLHFFRWTEQLQDAGHDIYWFNVTDSGEYTKRMDWINQCYGWRLKWDFPGRIRLKASFPKLNKFIEKFNTNATEEAFETYLKKVQPDVVHSFALYVSCRPILNTMKKYPNLKWVYSSWGSDLFYYQNIPNYLKDIKAVLPRIQYLFTDCKRDYKIAQKHGFKGEFLGVYPGGGGFKFDLQQELKQPPQRHSILIKGFQGRSGKAIEILKAIQHHKNELLDYNIIVFGAQNEVIDFAKKKNIFAWTNFKIMGRIPHEEVLKLMQAAKIYIGNSNSDGIPNTMLEAICYGAFPIQSNPGGATAEVIKHNQNGLLIEDCDDTNEIFSHIKLAINDKDLIKNAYQENLKIRSDYEYQIVKAKVLKTYQNLKPS